MISAEKAREIQRAAQDEQDAYVRAVIVREAEDVCEVIARAGSAAETIPATLTHLVWTIPRA